MSTEYSKIIIYEFRIEAISSIYFGGSNQGELVKDSEDNPVLFGNSIGGALRDYLESCLIPLDILCGYLGGNRDGEFIESKIYISDGEVVPHNLVIP